MNNKLFLCENTPIIMFDGSVKPLKDLTQGDEVLGHNGTNQCIDIVYKCQPEGQQELIPIKTAMFRELYVSPETYLRVSNYYKTTLRYDWKKSEHINKSHRLMLYGGHPVSKNNNLLLAEFLGYFTASGMFNSFAQHKEYARFSTHSPQINERITYLTKQLFGFEPKINHPKFHKHMLRFTSNHMGSKYNPLNRLFKQEKLYLTKKNRLLPSILWEMNEECVIRFLVAFIECKGSLRIEKETKKTWFKAKRNLIIKIYFARTDSLCRQIFWLMKKFNLEVSYPRNVSPKESSERKYTLWLLEISRYHVLSKLLNYRKFYDQEERSSEMLKIITEHPQEGKHLLYDGFYRSTFKRYKSALYPSYSLELYNYGNFFANGYLVSNEGQNEQRTKSISLP